MARTLSQFVPKNLQKGHLHFSIVCAKKDGSEFWVASLSRKFNMYRHYRIPNFLSKTKEVPVSIPGSATIPPLRRLSKGLLEGRSSKADGTDLGLFQVLNQKQIR
jgi:hypothetical protein